MTEVFRSLKISVIGPQFPDSFARNIVVTLETMGHKVHSLEGRRGRHTQGRYARAAATYLPKAFPVLESRMHSKMLAAVKSHRPDLVLVTYDFFGPDVVRRLKSAAQAPVICWYIDPIANLRGGGIFGCPYDLIFCKEPQLVETMADKLGLPAHYLPEACNPLWHKPVTPTREQAAQFGCDVAAQGTFHPYRAKFFEGLTEFDVRIWGSAASGNIDSPSRRFFQGKYIAEQEKAAAFRAAKILVNAMNFAEVRGVNNTLFEGAGCGAFQICDERPTLQEFFTRDEEIITFRKRAELVEKIRYYLSRDEERNKIAERAAARAHRDHTYEKRLSAMLKTANLG